jgi:hypothetical protein
MYVSYAFQQIVQAQMPILPTVRLAEIYRSSGRSSGISAACQPIGGSLQTEELLLY